MTDASICMDSPQVLDFKATLGLEGESDEDFYLRMVAERVAAAAADPDTYPLSTERFGVAPINPLPTSASENEVQ